MKETMTIAEALNMLYNKSITEGEAKDQEAIMTLLHYINCLEISDMNNFLEAISDIEQSAYGKNELLLNGPNTVSNCNECNLAPFVKTQFPLFHFPSDHPACQG